MRLWFTVAERAQRAATSENMQTDKAPANQENIFIDLTAGVANAHNQIKTFICSSFPFLVVLWVFAVRFFIWLCCEHLQHVFCQIAEVVFLICRWGFFLFAARWALSATVLIGLLQIMPKTHPWFIKRIGTTPLDNAPCAPTIFSVVKLAKVDSDTL